MRPMNYTILIFLLAFCPHQLKPGYPRPSTVVLIGSAPLVGYACAHKNKVFEAARWLKQGWDCLPTLIKYPALALGFFGTYYTFYNSLKQLPHQSDSRETKQLLDALIARIRNIENILKITLNTQDAQKADEPSIIAKLKSRLKKLEPPLAENQIIIELKGNARVLNQDLARLENEFDSFKKEFKNHTETTVHLSTEDDSESEEERPLQRDTITPSTTDNDLSDE